MPKQRITIQDWSGGMNNRQDPRDLQNNQYSYIRNMSIDALGKIKTSGGLYNAIEGSDGSTDLSEYIVKRTAGITGAGGYGLFYFESDHSGVSEQKIEHTKSGVALDIGTGNGDISFVKVKTTVDIPADIPDVGG